MAYKEASGIPRYNPLLERTEPLSKGSSRKSRNSRIKPPEGKDGGPFCLAWRASLRRSSKMFLGFCSEADLSGYRISTVMRKRWLICGERKQKAIR